MKFYVMDHSGHSTLEFTAEQKADADARFRALIGDGSTAATRKAGARDYTVIRSPEQIQDETLFMPRRVGG